MKYLIALALSLSLIGCGQKTIAAAPDTVTISKAEYEQLKHDAGLQKPVGPCVTHIYNQKTGKIEPVQRAIDFTKPSH